MINEVFTLYEKCKEKFKKENCITKTTERSR